MNADDRAPERSADPGCTSPHALVTGASSGIGRATALRLAREGHHVFATVRREIDGDRVRDAAAGALTPLIVDVRVADEIAQAAHAIADHVGDRGLDVLVNNAGYGLFTPLEVVPMERFRDQLDVNVSGQLAVTQAVLPHVRAARGRIVMIGSIADRITMPFAGAQAAGKRAVVALTEALRQELAASGIRVVLIEPASIRSEAIEKLERDVTEVLASFDARSHALYGTALESALRRALTLERNASDPDVVARAVARAVASRRPRPRYLVGRHARRLAVLALLPPAVLDAVRRRLFSLPGRPHDTADRRERIHHGRPAEQSTGRDRSAVREDGLGNRWVHL